MKKAMKIPYLCAVYFCLGLLLGLVNIKNTQAQNRNTSKPPKIAKAEGYSKVKNYNLDFLKSATDIFEFEDEIIEGDYYLFIIAVDKYKFWKPLNNAVKDAMDVKKVLMDKYGFRQENLYELLNEEATPENIRAQFEVLRKKGTNLDNLLIYYSGHGYYDPSFDLGYWVPSLGKTNSGATETFIPNDHIRDYIRELRFRHVLLVADACFSGALFAKDARGFKEDESLKSRWGLSSGNIEVVSDGKKGENSPFANTFIKYLRENLQDRIRVENLIEYVVKEVSQNTQQEPQGGYLSGVGSEGGQFVFLNQGQKEEVKESTEKEKGRSKKKE